MRCSWMRRSMRGWRRYSTSWTSVRLTLSAAATASSTVVRQSSQISVLFGGSPLSGCDRLSGTPSPSYAASLCSLPDPLVLLRAALKKGDPDVPPPDRPSFVLPLACVASPMERTCRWLPPGGLMKGADQSLLCHVRDERAALKQPGGGQPKATGRGRRDLVEQQPVVGAEGPMEPHRVIDGGRLHVQPDEHPVRHGAGR